jgi:hypothetical protein
MDPGPPQRTQRENWRNRAALRVSNDVPRYSDQGPPPADSKGEEFELRTLDTRIDIQTTKTLVETNVAEVKPKAERASCSRTGTGVGAVQRPKFDGSTSRAVFRRHFETVAEHSGWTPPEKATYLISALNEPAAHILHDVPTGATCDEITLRIATVTTTWKKRSTLSRREGPSALGDSCRSLPPSSTT